MNNAHLEFNVYGKLELFAFWENILLFFLMLSCFSEKWHIMYRIITIIVGIMAHSNLPLYNIAKIIAECGNINNIGKIMFSIRVLYIKLLILLQQ